MPYVSAFMYCEGTHLNNNPQGKQQMVVSGPLNIFRPMFVPGLFSFSLVFGVNDYDTNRDHRFQLLFLSPEKDDEPVIDTGVMHFPAEVDKNDLPEEMRGIMLSFDFRNVVFRREGIYKTVIIFDGERIGEFSIPVKGQEVT